MSVNPIACPWITGGTQVPDEARETTETSLIMRLKPTLAHSRAAHYRRPGGPWDMPTLDELLSRVLRTSGGVIADPSIRLEGQRLEEAVSTLAGGLRAAGVRRRDAVAWQLSNSAAAALLYRACWRLGAVAAPVHHAARAAEVEAALEQAEPRIAFGGPGSTLAETGAAVVAGGDRGGLDGLPFGEAVVHGHARPADLAAVLFTSGSSGRPKAVLHTQRGLAWKAALMARVHGLRVTDAVLMPAPLAHISGLLNGVLVPGAAGMKSVFMPRWDAELALHLIEHERISFMIGPPTFFVSLISTTGFASHKVDSLRLVSSGGAAVTPAFVDSASESLECRVKRTYGSTEAPTATTTTDADPLEKARETDGRAVGEVELRVSDPITGERNAPGRPGELWVRGPELFVGYADPVETAASHARGSWFRTGDLATVDREGWLRIVGRIKDVIIRGGENVSTTEVETVLESHPSVLQAVVVPYPDPVMGERVAAFVVSSEPFDLEACIRWFSERGVARFKTPERVVRLDSLPTMAAGKPDRAALRDMARRESFPAPST